MKNVMCLHDKVGDGVLFNLLTRDSFKGGTSERGDKMDENHG